MKEIFLPFTKKEWLFRMVFVGVLFVVVAAPFKSILTLVPGMTEVRPANMIPVVFGLIWGPAGAWGIAVANAITDVISGSGFNVWFPGFLINFFYAYLPYKMWYSLDLGRKTVDKPNLKSVSDIVRFIIIVFVDSLVTTVLLSVLFEYLGFQTYGSSGLLLFFNNFDFAVVLGIPVILLIGSRKNAVFWIPEGIERKGRRGYSTVSNIMLFSLATFGLVYYLLARFQGASIPVQTELWIFDLGILIEIAYVFKGFMHYENEVQKVNIRTLSIRAKVMLGFLLITVFCVVMVGVTAYMGRADVLSGKDLWEYIYVAVGISLNIMFVVSLLFLRYVEKNITIPVEIIAGEVDEFAGRDHLADVKDEVDLSAGRNRFYTGDEIEGLSEAFGHMMDDINSYVGNLVSVTAEKERIGAELDIATQIQADMLPSIFPAFPERPEIDIYASMNPAKEVGGDFYDFFMIDDDHIGMVMADVSGKGVPAALFMVIAKTLIKNQSQLSESPAEILYNVNNQLCEGNEAGLFVTVWLGIVQISTGKGMAANAGHEYPVIRRAGGQFELIKTKHSPAVACMEEMKFKEHEFELNRGDILYVYTDGVPEATDANNELYGTDRMLEALNTIPEDTSMENILKTVRASVDEFVGDAPQFDDLTHLAFVLK